MSIGDGTSSDNQRRHLYVEQRTQVGFFTDPTLCIGCKACEVACKEWNELPDDGYVFSGHSYDNTLELSASTWRHVKFVEQSEPLRPQLGPGAGMGWQFLSDVCKHCENAGCLEACPTGSIVRTEVGSVLVQDDICNGCGYCVVSCPFGVIDRRQPPPATVKTSTPKPPGTGGAFKCTFCYDRQRDGLTPACARTCPTESISFGPLDQVQQQAEQRVQALRARGVDAQLYNPTQTSVGGIHALSLTVGDPRRLGLPTAPEVPTIYLPSAWAAALATATFCLLASLALFALV